MKVAELIKKLNRFKPDMVVVLGSDEELNTLFSDVQVATLNPSVKGKEDRVVIWGNSGSEVE